MELPVAWSFHPLDAAELIEEIGLVGFLVARVIIDLVVFRAVEAGVGARNVQRVVGRLEPALAIEDDFLQSLGILLVVVRRPDVCFDVHATADVADGSCWVEGFAQVIDVAHETRELHAVGPPFLVHWRPSDDAWMVAVAYNLLGPFAEEVACNLRVVSVHAP